MRNSSRVCSCALLLALAGPASGQQQAQGFALERLYQSAPGGGWLVMDALDLHGGLGGVFALSLGYASDPLHVSDGTNNLAVVSDQAFVDVGAALTYHRWRFYLNIASPLAVRGQSGTVGDWAFTGPAFDLGSRPDKVTDGRIGTDVRLFGGPGGHFRLGVGAQLMVPWGAVSGSRTDYDTDNQVRGMVRVLFAGDARHFAYAGQLGVHLRPLDESATPGSPAGSELLFGVAAGAKLPVGRSGRWDAIIGPEIFGASAFRAFNGYGTALEGLLSGRIEGTATERFQMRVKLGVGAGLSRHFGAPDWRIVAGLEVYNRNARPHSSLPIASPTQSRR